MARADTRGMTAPTLSARILIPVRPESSPAARPVSSTRTAMATPLRSTVGTASTDIICDGTASARGEARCPSSGLAPVNGSFPDTRPRHVGWEWDRPEVRPTLLATTSATTAEPVVET